MCEWVIVNKLGGCRYVVREGGRYVVGFMVGKPGQLVHYDPIFLWYF